MAFGDWDDVIRVYKETYLNSKYHLHARAMLDLIPQIRTLPSFADVLPSTSHGTLLLEFHVSGTSLNVWYERSETYRVYLLHPDDTETGKRLVPANELIAVLEEYLQKIK